MVKLHARVTREIEVTEEQAERIINRLCGGSEHDDIADVLAAFTDGVNAGNYEAGYIPFEWLMADLESVETEENREYLLENVCVTDDIDLDE